jgi:putative oxidoreductase
MLSNAIEQRKDALILVARILIVILFLLAGIPKLTGFSGTIGYMASVGAPFPTLAAIVAVAFEVFGSLALLLGVFTRPIALVYMVYTLGASLIGHHYWTMEGAERMANFINFYKNLSIMGGFLLLAVTGAGRYAIDRS